jgi:ribosome biogenesis protein YTM1
VRLWDPRVAETTMAAQTLGGSTGMHTGWVSGIAWSPESAFHLFSCALDGEAKVWDVRASVPLHTLKAHDDKALCASWIDGSTMATGGADRRVVFHHV